MAYIIEIEFVFSNSMRQQYRPLSSRFFWTSTLTVTLTTHRISDALIQRRIHGRMMLFRLGLIPVDQSHFFSNKLSRPLFAVGSRV
jgi:hypothetical protein